MMAKIRVLAALTIRVLLEWFVMVPLTLVWAAFHFPALGLRRLMDAADDAFDRIEIAVGGEELEKDED